MMRMRRVSALLLAAAAASISACGTDVYMPVTGTVYGTVLRPDGAPAPGVLVVVEGTGLSAVTDGAGRFVVNGVVSVREGRIGITYDVRGEAELDGVPHGFVVMHFKVKEQQSYSIGTVRLQPTGTIRGSVSLEGETDASGVRVHLEGLGLDAVTNAAGSFIVNRVPPYARYTVVCEHEGFVSQSLTGVAVSAASETVLPSTSLARR